MEVTISTADVKQRHRHAGRRDAANDLQREVVGPGRVDAEPAKPFYASLGWRQDADVVISEDYRVMQSTPPGSQAWIVFGTGITAAAPGSIDRLLLGGGSHRGGA